MIPVDEFILFIYIKTLHIVFRPKEFYNNFDLVKGSLLRLH